jgi:3-dehydroquinate synthase
MLLQAVAGSERYEVLVGDAVLTQLGSRWRDRVGGGRVVVVSDENVAPLYLETCSGSLRAAGFEVSHVVIPAGESQKTLARAEELYGVLYDRHVSRQDTLVALGGGVIGDLTGFVAATYLRGLQYVQAPTTLLAQVDAALGGKVGVDFRAGKNHVGAFYQPGMVIADLATLATLPAADLRSGLAEVAKYALLAGGDLCAAIEAFAVAEGLPDERIVAGCAQLKLDVVARDVREAGERAVLNLGHTIGHAIEAAGQFTRFTHGEAVALGLRATLWLSVHLAGLPAESAARGQRLLSDLALPERLADVAPAEVAELVQRDKKRTAAGVGYVLLEELGEPRRDVVVDGALQEEAIAWLTVR